jgi:photosystem I P700 chlorophyll a apoprotein A2
MATKFPKFSQALAQDPATRRIWYGVATAHDLESHDGMTKKIFIKRFLLRILVTWRSSFYGHLETCST